MKQGEVYLVNFPNKNGNEFYGKHYAVILTSPANDGTLLVAPITGKKPGKKYRGGITLDNHKYQKNPSYDKAYIYVRKIQEIDKRKIHFNKKVMNNYFEKSYKLIFELDQEDLTKLKIKIKEILNLEF